MTSTLSSDNSKNSGTMVPIILEELTQLVKIGVKPSSIKFGGVCLESENQLSVLDSGQLIVYSPLLPAVRATADASTATVDPTATTAADPTATATAAGTVTTTVRKRPLSAQAAIINPPPSHLIAIRNRREGTSVLDILDSEEPERKLKTYTLRAEIQHWRWLGPSCLGLVTLSTVLHWSMEGDCLPSKLFDRCPAMGNFQVIDYKVAEEGDWAVLVGLRVEQDKMVGKLQLYSTEKLSSQLIDGHAACFTRFRFEGNPEESRLFCFAANQQTISSQQQQIRQPAKLHIVEIGMPKSGNRPIIKRSTDIFYGLDANNDFPVILQSSHKYGVLYLITKYGYLYLYDIETTTCIYANRISHDTIFVSVPSESTGGLIAVNRKGQVLYININIYTIIKYIKNILQNEDLAFRFASRNNLSGAEDIFISKFNFLFDSKEYIEAAKITTLAPNGILRTSQILQKFQNAPTNPGQMSPLLQYFGIILDCGQLNRTESLEICRPVLLQNKKNLLEKWLSQNKLDCSEELGNLVQNVDKNLALSVYLRANVPHKVVECFAVNGQYEKIIQYSEKVNYEPDYIHLLRNVINNDSPDKGLEFAKIISKNNKKLNEISSIVDLFMEKSLIQQCTGFLLEVLQNTDESESVLQTKLLEINLMYAPQVADAILGNHMYNYYDKIHIGRLCEQFGLLKRALEHYSEIEDIKRVLTRADFMETDWLITYFGNLSVEQSMECLKCLMSTNKKSNKNVCLQIAIKYQKQLTVKSLIELFESYNCTENLFCFLGSIIHENTQEEIHFKYIQSACELGQLGVVTNMCQNSNYYSSEKVKNYLKESNITDYTPLMIVCDRFNYVHELIFYLYNNKLEKYIKYFVKNINPSRLPVVVGELLDLDCCEEFIKNLISDIGNNFSIDDLIHEFENRNRLRIIWPWLEGRAMSGNTESAIHNALGKIYIDNNKNPEKYLKENNYYNTQLIGRYCESRNPSYSCIAYEKGGWDKDLLRIYKENSLFKQAAKFLVESKKLELWSSIMKENDDFRKNLIDQIIHSIILESVDPNEISVTVKAFMAAEMLIDLIELIDNILCNNNIFSEEPNLQNLLILTSMKVDKKRLKEFIEKFNHYSAEEISNIAINNEMYNEALTIYKKFKKNNSAINVITKYLNDFEEGQSFAELCNEKSVWYSLGEAQLARGFVKDAIKSYIKSENPSNWEEVVEKSKNSQLFEDLVKYLEMSITKIKESSIENELLYAYAKTGRLDEMKQFISSPNNANVNKIADICYEENIYEAAKILYNNSANFSNLSLTFIKLREFQKAVDCARKANKIQTWKNVCFACLQNEEFQLAQISAMNIIVNAEELEHLVNYYENEGYFEELIAILELGLCHERVHMGIFTQLAILYAKYKSDKLTDYLETFWSRINIAKVTQIVEMSYLWKDLVFLYDKYEHYENALKIIIEHPTETWKDNYFIEISLKISNHQLHLKAVQFYIEHKPLLLNNYLISLSPKLDNSKIVEFLLEENIIEMVKPYLLRIQKLNDKIVNETLNGILMNEEDYEGLRVSIEKYDNFDGGLMSKRLETSDLVEMRRLAGKLMKKCKKYEECIHLCFKNGLYSDAIEAAAESRCSELAEELLNKFAQGNKQDCLVGCLFQCYDLLRPDYVLELVWTLGYLHVAIPYLIQVIREFTDRVNKLEKNQKDKSEDSNLQREIVGSTTAGNRLEAAQSAFHSASSWT